VLFRASNPVWGANTLPGGFDSHVLPPFYSQFPIFIEDISLTFVVPGPGLGLIVFAGAEHGGNRIESLLKEIRRNFPLKIKLF